MKQQAKRGFTLVELLVVIGVIAILISILLPALQKARESASAIKCAANLRGIGQGLAAYESENNDFLPIAYNYRNTSIDPLTNTQSPDHPQYGYTHWSSLLFGAGEGNDSFRCPSMEFGGFPPADPQPGNFDSGQTTDNDTSGSVVTAVDGAGNSKTYWPDDQAPRMSYALNDNVCGRNFFVQNFGVAANTRTYRNVRVSLISKPTLTILATEYIDEWGIVSDVTRGGSAGVVCKSYRTIQPFRMAAAGQGFASCDISTTTSDSQIRQTNRGDFYTLAGGQQSLDPIKDYGGGNYLPSTISTRLDWVGRNHSRAADYADRKSNFLYMDGHVELKSILLTVPTDSTQITPWEWGDAPFSMSPHNVVGRTSIRE